MFSFGISGPCIRLLMIHLFRGVVLAPEVKYLSVFVQVVFKASPSFAERVRKQVEKLGGKFETVYEAQ